MRDARIQLGTEVKDRITGFSGIAICQSQWLNGCIRISVQPRTLDKDNKPVDYQAFDIEQLEYVGEGVNMRNKETGGPMPDVRRDLDDRPSDPNRRWG